jgi:hypothetical protein
MPLKDPEARKAYAKMYAQKNPAYARVKAWRAANPEMRAAQNERYAERHPENIKARQDRYLERHVERVLEMDRAVSAAYRARNPEKVAASKKRYAQANKHKVNAAVTKREAAKLQRTPKWLTNDDLWMIEQAYELAVLRGELFGFAWHVDHVFPLQGKQVSGLHAPTNLQVIPWVDNLRKGNRLEADHG